MSKFRTEIPVDVAAVKALLPKDSTIVGVAYDPAIACVVLDWEHGRMETRFRFSVDFPLESLQAKQVPTGIVVAGVTQPAKAVESAAVTEDKASSESVVEQSVTTEGVTAEGSPEPARRARKRP